MSEFQIDPYKLNDVLQQILDKVTEVQEKSGGASPEFQVLMNNYLTKANEAERNQARFEEALERLDLSEHEAKKLKTEVEELKERIRSYERDFDTLRSDHEKEIHTLRNELNHAIQSNNEIESNVSAKYIKEINAYKSEAERQILQLQEDLSEANQGRRKLEEKLNMKSQEADAAERELSDLKVKLADEQSKIREEIIEATKRSVQIEQSFQRDKEQMIKKIKELENTVEELNSNLTLRQRELEYKDALLTQAIRQPVKTAPDIAQTLSVNRTASLLSTPDNSYPEPTTFSPSPQPVSQLATPYATPVEQFTTVASKADPETTLVSTKEKKVGGIWSKLSSS
ncbi:MAG: hypothetical protein SFU25_11485 [Candidatus Caenarcaniphilales bacterium]|nr:hypothetical protein [Candidatus Caenarcaniphilales bacterium]